MPPRHNDGVLDAHIRAYAQIASDGINRNGSRLSIECLKRLRDSLYSAPPIILPASMFDSLSISFEIATEEPPEETVNENSEELDNFLKEFALKEVY